MEGEGKSEKERERERENVGRMQMKRGEKKIVSEGGRNWGIEQDIAEKKRRKYNRV